MRKYIILHASLDGRWFKKAGVVRAKSMDDALESFEIAQELAGDVRFTCIGDIISDGEVFHRIEPKGYSRVHNPIMVKS